MAQLKYIRIGQKLTIFTPNLTHEEVAKGRETDSKGFIKDGRCFGDTSEIDTALLRNESIDTGAAA